MKYTKIVLALSLAGVVSVSNAANLQSADFPAAGDAAVDNAEVIYIGGASAQTPGLSSAIAFMCATTPKYFAHTTAKDYMAWKCNGAKSDTSVTGTTLAGKPFIVVKTDKDGSYAGLAPQVNQTSTSFADIANATTTTYSPAAALYRGASNAGSVPAALVQKIPDIALSDVSVDLWKKRAVTPLLTGNTYTAVNNFAGQGFGIAATPELYKLMQVDQFGAACSGVTSYACQPSISKAQYASFVSERIDINGNLLPNTTTGLPTAYKLHRRNSTSGTQAASDAYFLNNGCTNTTLGGEGTARTSAQGYSALVGSRSAALTVVEQTSTSTVVGTSGLMHPTEYALGVVSLENTGLNFLKINGISPNYKYDKANSAWVADSTQKVNLLNGSYDFQYAPTITRQTSLSGSKLDFFNALLNKFGDGADMVDAVGIYALPQAAITHNDSGTARFHRNGKDCGALTYKKNY